MTRKTRAVAILAGVAAVALGAAAVSNVTSATGQDTPRPQATHTNSTPIKHVVVIFERERLVRPLLRHLPERHQHSGKPFHARAHTPAVNGLTAVAAHRRTPTGSIRAGSTRPTSTTCSPATRTTTTRPSRPRSTTARWTSSPPRSAPPRAPTPQGQACQASDVMNYYDGNTVTGDVELRPALRHERQLLRHDLRSLGARRHQPGLGRHRRRRPAHSVRGALPVPPATERRPWPTERRLLAHRRRPAVLRRLLEP